jgi:cell division protein FtsB
MTLLEALRRRAAKAIWPGLSVGAIIYFGYHAVNGERGLVRAAQLAQQLEQATVAAQAVAAERERWTARVQLLRSDSLDPDLLDERARFILGLTAPDEVVLYNR